MDLLREVLFSISLPNAIDIVIMTCLIYLALEWFSWTRAVQIIAVLLGMGLFYFVASKTGLALTSLLFEYLWAALIIVLVIVFQPEIRAMLDRARPIRILTGRAKNDGESEVLEDTLKAVAELARLRLGALIVFQRVDHLDNLVVKGADLECIVSHEAIVMIFQKTSPLHDGAILIVNDRVKAASCILPLSSDESLEARYGTRHRAALGLSERSDALCVVVSEERGEVSIVDNKEITNFRKKEEFKRALYRGLQLDTIAPDSSSGVESSMFTRNWRLKILSLITAMVLWLVVVGPERTEIGVEAAIQYTGLPEGMELTGKWMDKLDVMVRGSEAGLTNLKQGSVRATVDLSGVVTGVNFFRITEKNIAVPPGMKIAKIRPSDLRLKIESASVRTLKVSAAINGSLPAGQKIRITPSQVKVRGLHDDLEKLQAVITEPIDVEKLKNQVEINAHLFLKPEGIKVDSIEPSVVKVTWEAINR